VTTTGCALHTSCCTPSHCGVCVEGRGGSSWTVVGESSSLGQASVTVLVQTCCCSHPPRHRKSNRTTPWLLTAVHPVAPCTHTQAHMPQCKQEAGLAAPWVSLVVNEISNLNQLHPSPLYAVARSVQHSPGECASVCERANRPWVSLERQCNTARTVLPTAEVCRAFPRGHVSQRCVICYK
jgi:hypothetical protein